MWQPDDDIRKEPEGRPDSWSVIRERLDHRQVSAYCALRFEGYTAQRVMQEFDLSEEEIEPAIRRGAQVYGHDVEDALSRLLHFLPRSA